MSSPHTCSSTTQSPRPWLWLIQPHWTNVCLTQAVLGTRGYPNNPRIYLYNIVYILLHVQTSVTFKVQYTYWDVFYTVQNSVWTGRFWCLLMLLLFFLHLFHISKTFPFKDFFPPRETNKKSLRVKSGEQWWWGTGVMPFLIKNCWTLSAVWTGVLVNHLSWNRHMCWKSL